MGPDGYLQFQRSPSCILEDFKDDVREEDRLPDTPLHLTQKSDIPGRTDLVEIVHNLRLFTVDIMPDPDQDSLKIDSAIPDILQHGMQLLVDGRNPCAQRLFGRQITLEFLQH